MTRKKPNPDGFCLGTRTGPCRTGSGGMWPLGGVGGGGQEPARPLSPAPPGPLSPLLSPQREPRWVLAGQEPHSRCFTPWGAAGASPGWGDTGQRGGCHPVPPRAGGAETCHREDMAVALQGSTPGRRQADRDRRRQGKVCPAGRAPGTVLPDVGRVPRGAPQRLLGPPSPTRAAPSAAACPGASHSLGPSPLPRGCQGHGACWGPSPLPRGCWGHRTCRSPSPLPRGYWGHRTFWGPSPLPWGSLVATAGVPLPTRWHTAA